MTNEEEIKSLKMWGESLETRLKKLEVKPDVLQSEHRFIDVERDEQKIVDNLEINTLKNSITKEEYGLLTDTQKTDLTDGGTTTLHSHNISKSRAYQSTQQSIDSGDATKINLQTENYDVNSELANSRFTAKIAGYYQVNASILWLASADTKVCQTQIRVSGDVAAADAKRSPGTGYISSNISDIVYLDVDDYVEMYGYQDSGGAVNLQNNSQSTFLSISKL